MVKEYIFMIDEDRPDILPEPNIVPCEDIVYYILLNRDLIMKEHL